MRGICYALYRFGAIMLNKRQFLIGATSVIGTAALPGMAAAYDVPPGQMPVLVRIQSDLPANEIHVDPNRFFLYWTLGGGQAVRYMVGVGKPGLYESGSFYVGAKKEWPSWKPTKDMVERNPKYKKFEDGVPGGPENPLGSRALYLFYNKGGDSFLRIHGTPQPWTIGSAVSNGCARLVNAHIEHLYNQVPKGSKVVLYPQG